MLCVCGQKEKSLTLEVKEIQEDFRTVSWGCVSEQESPSLGVDVMGHSDRLGRYESLTEGKPCPTVHY